MYRYVILIIFGVLILGNSSVFADESIPNWIKQLAGFWSNNQISDSEFLNAIKYMLQHEIITISDDTFHDITPIPNDIIPNDIIPNDIVPNSTIVSTVPNGAMMHNMIMVNQLHHLDDNKTVEQIEMWLEAGEDPNVTNCSREAPDTCIESWLNEGREAGDKEIPPLERIRDELDDIQFDWLIRSNSQFVGETIFLEGIILEVADVKDDKYEILLDIHQINFEYDNGFVVIKYEGPRMRDGDTILVAGTISGLEVIEISNRDVIVKSNNKIDTSSTQVELPYMTASRIHVLAHPNTFIPGLLNEGALNVSRDTLKEHREILEGSLVHFEGTVTSIQEEEFRLNTSESSNDVSMVTVKYFGNVLNNTIFYDGDEVSRYDKVRVYGIATAEMNGTNPVIVALHIH